ncbi:MAG TPA: hypothetical protein VJ063_13385, partial [Verrucomicrobiae bacterium]|nr:hypothetical protein [Verrucomicrobiae bacterium]
VIISWFKPLDETFDGPTYSNQVYFMVVNGLTDPAGTAADCLQEIRLNFAFPASITSLDMLNSTNGQVQTQTLPLVANGSRRQLVLNLNGGDAALFKPSSGAPFVGFAPPAPARLDVRIQTNTVAVGIEGATGVQYQVQRAAALPSVAWAPWTNVLMSTSRHVVFEAKNSNSNARRFYRALALP